MQSALTGRMRRSAAMRPIRMRRLRRPAARTMVIALLAVGVLGGGFVWFRDSSFVSVERVQIAGVTGEDAAAIDKALEGAARRMSTMDFSAATLRSAVAQYPIVRSLQVSARFPHQMMIAVTEQPPVADLSLGSMRMAVAADGVVLGPAPASSSRPQIPAMKIPPVGKSVSEGRLLSYLRVLGAAPVPLLAVISRIYEGKQGLTIQMRNGLLAYFGDSSRPHAKWDSLVTVLTDHGSAGATYVDVRLPERPAAGMPQGKGGVGSGEVSEGSALDPSSAALAESLARAINGEPALSTPTTSSTPGSVAGGSASAGSSSSTGGASPSSSTTSSGSTSASAPASEAEATPGGGAEPEPSG